MQDSSLRGDRNETQRCHDERRREQETPGKTAEATSPCLTKSVPRLA
jgi:hypothetical protein